MSLPSEVKVGPFVFTVRGGADVVDFFSATDGDLGDCNTEHLLIRVSGAQAPGNQREVVWHEALHAAFYSSGLTAELTEKVEENIVRKLATATLAVLRDNPSLVTYLTDG